MANQHTKKKEREQKQEAFAASRAALAESEKKAEKLAQECDELSGLVADILGSVRNAVAHFHAPSAYFEGQVMYKKYTAPLDPSFNCAAHMRDGLGALTNIVLNGNARHSEIIGEVVQKKVDTANG